MPTTVETPSSAYLGMAKHWDLVHDLLGGTIAMRAAGEKWLPREPREEEIVYQTRLMRSYLYGAYGDTIERLVSKPFSKPLTYTGTLPDQLEIIKDDVNRSGQDLASFTKEVMAAGMNYGLTHILVDFPTAPMARTLADEKEQNLRPTFVHVTPCDLIGWRTQEVNGVTTLMQVRIRECRTEPDGEFGDKTVHYIRVIEPTKWALYRRDGEAWVLAGSGVNTQNAITLVTIYFNRTGFMTGLPCLEDLAWLNLAHWQSLSDQRNILRFARVGTLFASGFTPEEIERGFTIGPTQVIASANAEANIRYVEHTGAAIKAGQDDLTHLENRMEVLGLQPLIQRQGQSTAFSAAVTENKNTSQIQMWIRRLEAGLEAAFGFAARWMNIELPEEFKIDIYNDFALTLRTQTDVDQLIKIRMFGDLDRETFLEEIKRRGVIADDTDVEGVIQKLNDEAPPLASILPGRPVAGDSNNPPIDNAA